LLLNQSVESLGTKLRQCRLYVSAAQTASGRCILKNGILTLLSHSLKQWRLLETLYGLLLCFGTLQTDQGLLLAHCSSASCDIRSHQLDQRIKLSALFFYAFFCCCRLSLPSTFCCFTSLLCSSDAANRVTKKITDKTHLELQSSRVMPST